MAKITAYPNEIIRIVDHSGYRINAVENVDESQVEEIRDAIFSFCPEVHYILRIANITDGQTGKYDLFVDKELMSKEFVNALRNYLLGFFFAKGW